MATDYATKWVETQTLRTNTVMFLYEYILTKFGCPLTIMTYKGTHFINVAIKYLIGDFILKHTNSTIYYPLTNGHAKFINKVFLKPYYPNRLMRIIMTTMNTCPYFYFHIKLLIKLE